MTDFGQMAVCAEDLREMMGEMLDRDRARAAERASLPGLFDIVPPFVVDAADLTPIARRMLFCAAASGSPLFRAAAAIIERDRMIDGGVRINIGREELVEGVDFTVDREHGIVRFHASAPMGLASIVAASPALRTAKGRPAISARRVAQWKTERRGRR